MTSTPGGIGRRERFILAIALGAGLGVSLVPEWTQNNLWPKTDGMSSTLSGFRDAVIITLSTGYRCALRLLCASAQGGSAPVACASGKRRSCVLPAPAGPASRPCYPRGSLATTRPRD